VVGSVLDESFHVLFVLFGAEFFCFGLQLANVAGFSFIAINLLATAGLTLRAVHGR
jgi:hypothetical protein